MRLAQAVGELAEFALSPVVLSGDLHWSMAAYLVHHKATEPIAVELMTTSVMSPGFDQYLPQVRPNAVRDATLELNPMLKYMETARRGWLALTAGKARCLAVWQRSKLSISASTPPRLTGGLTSKRALQARASGVTLLLRRLALAGDVQAVRMQQDRTRRLSSEFSHARGCYR